MFGSVKKNSRDTNRQLKNGNLEYSGIPRPIAEDIWHCNRSMSKEALLDDLD